MHRELRNLALPRGGSAAPERLAPTRAASFAEAVAGELEGGVLRHSRRDSLLRRAAGDGIGRFEANLIIAAVQHERRGSTMSARPRETARPGAPPGTPGWLAALLIAIGTEVVLALAAWQVLT